MKFHSNFHKPARRRGQKNSQSSSDRRHKYDITAIQSWNELRKIGGEGKQPKGAENVFKEEDEEILEGHDWDFYIAQFNEQYKHHAHEDKDVDNESAISTIADTKSQLFRSRHRRMHIFRKCFIFSCLLQWAVCFWGAHSWYLNYLIYPLGFLDEIDTSLFAYYYTTDAKWIAFLLNAHSWFVGSFGLMCAFCFREKPELLKQYILRIPYMLLIPMFLIFVSVRFVGTLSSQKLAEVMDKKIPEYHNFENLKDRLKANEKKGKRLWDQLQKILQCCGVHSAQDWDSVDTDLTDDVSYWPATCCPKPFARRDWTKEVPNKDDCFYKINHQEKTTEYEWAYPEGCLNLAYEFFVKMGALVVGQMFCSFCILCMALAFAYKYYTMLRKVQELNFKYSWQQWLRDIFFIEHFKKCNCRKRTDPPREPKPSKHQSLTSGNLSQMSGESVKLGDRLTMLPSVIITAPIEGSETDLEDPDTRIVLRHNPDDDKAFDAPDDNLAVEEDDPMATTRVLFDEPEEEQ